MATYNDLPTEITAIIFSYLRHERRKPDHYYAIERMIWDIDDNIIMRDSKIRIPYTIYEALGNFIDYDDTIVIQGFSPFGPRDRKWYRWWNGDRGRMIGLWYINIVLARLDEVDFERILGAYLDEGDIDEYICSGDLSVEISGQWVFTNC